MDLLRWVLFGVLPAIAAMLLGVGVGGSRCLAIALATAICVPFGMQIDWPGWPWDLDGWNGHPRRWLWWCLAAAGVLGTAYDLKWLPKWLAAPLEVALVVFVPWFLSAPLRANSSFEWCVVWLGAGWLVVFATWYVLRGAGRAVPGMAVPLVGMLALGADAWLLRRHGANIVWEVSGVGAVALLFAFATTLWRRPFVCGTGAALCITIAHVGLLWCGHGARDLRSTGFMLALAVPLPLWLPLAKFFAESKQTGLVLGVGGAIGLAGAVLVVG